MTRFITGKDLEDAISSIIWDAKQTLLIVSPFIKLDTYFIEMFDRQVNNFDLHLLLVFGKNEGNISKSLSKNDFDYFKKFPKVSIIYVPTLHAKYYGNETKGVITSINLYDYSFKNNNIEFGVYTELGLLSSMSQSSDQQAWQKCQDIANGGEPVYIKRPVFRKKFLNALTGGKDYMKSEVLHDDTEYFYSNNKRTNKKKLSEFPDDLDYDHKADTRPTREEVEKKETGYCIRTGVQIPFNPDKPFSAEAYKSWAQWSNYDFKEKYCHKTGQQSYGKTSMRHPILQ